MTLAEKQIYVARLKYCYEHTTVNPETASKLQPVNIDEISCDEWIKYYESTITLSKWFSMFDNR
jgi:hypothetical protein